MMEYYKRESFDDHYWCEGAYITPELTITVSGPEQSERSMCKRPDGWWVDGNAGREEIDDSEEVDDEVGDMFDFRNRKHCQQFAADSMNPGSCFETRFYAVAIVFCPA
jgi:hypothetical protein